MGYKYWLVLCFSTFAIYAFILEKIGSQLILSSTSIKLILIGVFALLLGLFPYILLGYPPTFLDWTSRHQLLLPLGSAIFVVGILGFFEQRKRFTLMFFLIALSISMNIKNYADFYRDWNKQQMLVSLFRQSDDVKNAGIIAFIDETRSLNAIGRTYRNYEWNGLLKLAFGNQIRYGTDGIGFESVRQLGLNNKNFNEENNNAEFLNDGSRPNLIVKIFSVKTTNEKYLFNSNMTLGLKIEYPK